MADNLQHKHDSISKRLARLIVTRSPSNRGEIPEDNLAERDVDDRKSGQAPVEQGDTGEVDQEG
jgi:hypothetical protein